MLRFITRPSVLGRSGVRLLGPNSSGITRPISRLPAAQGLYDPANERDNCGVGLVAHLKGQGSRGIVEDANRMLVRMSHRGGCGCEPSSGDGAGILVGMPHEFFKGVASRELGFTLPEKGMYGVGNIFLNRDPELAAASKQILEMNLVDRGLKVLGWRQVPIDNSTLGPTSLGSEPLTEQIFVENVQGLDAEAFDRELFFARTAAGFEVEATGNKDFYVVSLSSGTITYKGQLTPEQVMEYYVDLQQPEFTSHVALVHSRFSTNTFPSWDRAQPNRVMCHNGEINTLRGNKNWMGARGGLLGSKYFGHDTARLLPAVSDNMSDSGNFDSVLEVLHKAGGRSLPQSMMMMIPEAWQAKTDLPASKRAMYEYFSCMMEPWDGPAMMAFTDGRYIGATLDRNGLRPSRFYVTHDDRVLLSSEVGVVPDLDPSLVREKSRLEPGRMFLVDFEGGRIVADKEVKEQLAGEHPYGQWLADHHLNLSEWVKDRPVPVHAFDFANTNRRLNMFGYTSETMEMLLLPMAADGKESLGSMGTDTPIAVLSKQPTLPFAYFKQLFAQVTNPPIDPIREELVMSLRCPVGPERNLLETTPEHAQRLTIEHPVLTLEEAATIQHTEHRGWRASTLDATFAAGSGAYGLQDALARLCDEASAAVQGEDANSATFGVGESPAQLLVLSDRAAGPGRLPVPSLLALGAVHQHLLRTQQRPKVALVCMAGDAREIHDMATLLGFGADAVCPYVAYEALARMNEEGLVLAKAGELLSDSEVMERYRSALGKGLLKVMSKMGISTLHSYKGAQVFEALGLGSEVVDTCFTGTTSRISGAGWDALYTDIVRFHEMAFPAGDREQPPLLHNPGQLHLRHGGEAHLNTPIAMTALQAAARGDSREAYRQYVEESDKQMAQVTLRGLLKFRSLPSGPIPLEQVEPASEIVKRFVTGAMSLGSISQETHESLAVAMNQLGGRSNTGEGGEDPSRFTDNRRSSIKQVASGRFGVTSHYLANADQIQIKMAQGAKPGEGGELPGGKVSKYIGSIRHTTPGVGLISPPPHHDIYSIEDLAQLIHDLKCANPVGEVSVKLVSEVGVGVIAAGVAKAKADHITVSGYDGGTGAAVWTSIKNAGVPWELGLAEAQQTLVLNDLRSRVKLQTDGQLKTGRDVVMAGLLGAEEFAFATAPLIALGCIMMRKCHLNTCPVGIATQDPVLREKFAGKPEHVVNFFFLMAEEIREHMAALGVSRFSDLIGRSDLLEVDEKRLHYKSRNLDLSGLLAPGDTLRAGAGTIHSQMQDHGTELLLDNSIIEQAHAALKSKEPVTLELPITNLDRSLGTMLSYQVSKLHGADGLPHNTITLNLRGHAGQSVGFCLAKGITMNIEGDCNDYVGKGLSGGSIAVFPDRNASDGYTSKDNVIIGNVALYGATSGSAFFNGKAGERFAVRNSGATAVVEGVGDHGCEYMTGGNVVVLGRTGRNFAAGMSGGIAYVLDEEGRFPTRCNPGSVDLVTVEAPEEIAQLRDWIQQHVDRTGSAEGQRVLDQWESGMVSRFVKVYPDDYRRVLEANAAEEAAAAAAASRSSG